jgi:hypothetical protein
MRRIRTPIAEELGLEVPVFAFSKAPAVVAAVSRAGGMGVLGAVAYTVDQLRDALDWIDANVDGKPYGVVTWSCPPDVDGGAVTTPRSIRGAEAMIPPRHRAFIDELLASTRCRRCRRARRPGTTCWPGPSRPPGRRSSRASRPIKPWPTRWARRPATSSSAPTPRGQGRGPHRRPAHARKHIENGVDIIVAQGTEAEATGGRSRPWCWSPRSSTPSAPTCRAAAGGTGWPPGRRRAALGAQGAWTGSIWLTAAESDVEPLLKQKLMKARRATPCGRGRHRQAGAPAQDRLVQRLG